MMIWMDWMMNGEAEMGWTWTKVTIEKGMRSSLVALGASYLAGVFVASMSLKLPYWLIGTDLILDSNLHRPAGQEHGEWCDSFLLQILRGGCDWRCTGVLWLQTMHRYGAYQMYCLIVFFV
jgi:hypothetical protein